MLTTVFVPLILIHQPSHAKENQTPVVSKSMVQSKFIIKPGETLSLQFKNSGTILSDPKIVNSFENVESVVKFEFTKEEFGLLLTVESKFKKHFQYRALMRLRGSENLIETNVLLVKPEGFTGEHWSDPIEELELFDFKLLDKQL